MRIPSTPRRTGARNKPVHFTYVGVERGPPTEAYIAGPTWWGWLHMSKPSKPCVYELTAGATACRFCSIGNHRVAVMKGWVPLYRKIDGLAWMIPVDEAQRDIVDALKTFAKVLVGRGAGRSVGVWVQPATNQEPVWSSTLPERSEPADVSTSLLTVWAVPEVTSYFCRASDNAVSLAPAGPVPAAGPGPEEQHQVDAQEYTPPGGEDGPLAGDYDAIKARLSGKFPVEKPSKNGRHRPAE